MDTFFAKGFKASKCKTLLKLTIPRIKLLRNRREIQIKQMRRDIAKLLGSGQEATARIRVEHIIREEKMMGAQEIVELFCELIAVRLPIIEAQRDCPIDLKEAISSVCFAAPRCADLPELQQVQMSFASKYGKEFVAAATELMPDCGVNRQLIELLSIRAPPPETKLKLLKDIAEEHGLEWDPTASEAELLKSHDDLLNGPAVFVSGSVLPLPKEKHEESFHNELNRTLNEQPGSETSLQMLDFPNVPKESVRENLHDVPAPETAHFMSTSADCKANDEPFQHSSSLEHDLSEKNAKTLTEHKEVVLGNITHYQDEETDASVAFKEGRQFVPFIAPPSDSPGPFSEGLSAPEPSADSPESVSVGLRAPPSYMEPFGSVAVGLGASQSYVEPPGSAAVGLGAPQPSADSPRSVAVGLGAPQPSADSPGSVAVGLGAPQSSADSPGSVAVGLGAPQSSAESPGSVAVGLGTPQSSTDSPGSVTVGLGAPQPSADSPGSVAVKLGAPQPSAESPGSVAVGLGTLQSSTDSPGSVTVGLGAQSYVEAPESFSAGLAAPQSSFSRTKSDATSVDLQDVLTAAQAAAETAERAAAAARSAATLAQMRISELNKKKSIAGAEDVYNNPFHMDTQGHSSNRKNKDVKDYEIRSDSHHEVIAPADTGFVCGHDNPFHPDTQDHSATSRNMDDEDHDIPSDYQDKIVTPTDTGIGHKESDYLSNGSVQAPKFDGDVPDSNPHNPSDTLAYQSSSSIEDESYFAYPNLFSSQNSFKSSTAQPFTEKVRSSHEP
ncbi:hypothetical protein MLD38_024595 [Melastoma candidum]|uniref:Uncharacterized protein n=1 Tax=Melastoma candidum TaxID=119954 RepID=A0ACB9NTR6_9MYRT|nr:hypothetical protein MLD38_024595 [Melastoma candidum]